MKNEDGFHFLEYPAASGKPDALVIFLHGYGNHPEMFKDFPAHIQEAYPNADVLLVRGPVPLNASQAHKDEFGVGHVDDLYSWYKTSKKAGDGLELALSHLFNRVPVVDDLNAFADAQLEKRGLKDDGLVLYGFSLGGAMVVQMATHRDEKCAAVVAHSSPVFPIIKPKSKPDTMLLMGDGDDYFYTTPRKIEKPQTRFKKVFDRAVSGISVHFNSSVRRLKRAGLPTTGVLVKNLGHNINAESFDTSVNFLAERLKNRP
ncbi:MAG: dienelactone hydrolase family protein [Micavibrio sp.]|nr:dienelactone hydrolase family protein [Micavibrio sp.]